ncbi:MAG: mercuric transporter MerT family protein [Rhodanobacteraceae bacterium]
MKAKYAALVSALLSSICCLGPLILIAFGLGAGAAVIGHYHWLFLGAAVAVLAWAWMKHFREGAAGACELRATNDRRGSILTLSFVSLIVAAFAALNVDSDLFAGAPPPLARSADLQRVIIPVEGMTCATCEIAVHNALTRIDGVASAHPSGARKSATVDYDPKKVSVEEIVAAISATGYRASAPQR